MKTELYQKCPRCNGTCNRSMPINEWQSQIEGCSCEDGYVPWEPKAAPLKWKSPIMETFFADTSNGCEYQVARAIFGTGWTSVLVKKCEHPYGAVIWRGSLAANQDAAKAACQAHADATVKAMLEGGGHE